VEALGQHLLDVASFDEIQPLAYERAVWWSAEDNEVIINIDADKVKLELEYKSTWGNDDEDNERDDTGNNIDYSVFSLD
jgi:hypothetical protein